MRNLDTAGWPFRSQHLFGFGQGGASSRHLVKHFYLSCTCLHSAPVANSESCSRLPLCHPGCVALEALLQLPEEDIGSVISSCGALLPETLADMQDDSSSTKIRASRVPIRISCGQQDELTSVSSCRASVDYLERLGYSDVSLGTYSKGCDVFGAGPEEVGTGYKYANDHL